MPHAVLALLFLLVASSIAAEPVVAPAMAVSPMRASTPHGLRYVTATVASPHGFLTFWRDERYGGGLVMARFTPGGELLDPDGAPLPVPGWQLHWASAAWNGREYLVLASASRQTAPRFATLAIRLLPDGTITGEPQIVPFHTVTVVAGSDGTGMIFGYRREGMPVVARLNADGSVNESSVTELPTVGQVLDVDAYGNELLLYCFGNVTTLARVRIGTGIVGRAEIAQQAVLGAVATDGLAIFVVWDERISHPTAPAARRIRITPMDAFGLPRPATTVDEFRSNGGLSFDAVWNGSAFVSAWSSHGRQSLLRVATTTRTTTVRTVARDEVGDWYHDPHLAAGSRTLLLTRHPLGGSHHTQLAARVFDNVATLDETLPAVEMIRRGVPVQGAPSAAIGSRGTLAVWSEWDGAHQAMVRFFPGAGRARPASRLSDGASLSSAVAAVAGGFVVVERKLDSNTLWAFMVVSRFDADGLLLDSFRYPVTGDIWEISLAGGTNDALLAWSSADGVHASRIALRGTPETIFLAPGRSVTALSTANGDFVAWVERPAKTPPPAPTRIHLARVTKPGEAPLLLTNVWFGDELHAYRMAASADDILLLVKATRTSSCVEASRISPASGRPRDVVAATIDCTDNHLFQAVWSNGSWWVLFAPVTAASGEPPRAGYLHDLGSGARHVERSITLDERAPQNLFVAPNGLLLTFARSDETSMYASRGFLQRVLLDARRRAARH